MSVPTNIFIDTSVLDEQNYNFSSAAIFAFVEAAKAQNMILLLPDPTRREIKRHIEKQAQEVVKALEQARRKAPFLKKWKAWPVKSSGPALDYQLASIANEEWESFLKQFKVENLDYSGVSLVEVMDWYDCERAPFGCGRKKNEFPDAFAVATLLAYGRSNAVSIAVVSKDKDFERACAPYTELLYFPSLPAFTEAILSGDRRVSQAKKAIDTDRTAIVEKIREQFPWRGFYHGEDYQADIEDIEVDDVVITNVRIIHIGGTELTMAFDATVHYSAYVRADDHSTAVVDSSEDFYMVWQEYRGTVQDQAEISAVAKCSVGHDWRTVKEVVMLEIQEDDICVEALPEQRFSIGEESRD